jgi:hypothetical protein
LDEEERPWVREGDITLLHTQDQVSILLLGIMVSRRGRSWMRRRGPG